MARTVKRAFTYRFYPTGEQEAELARTFGCVRLVYNRALTERTRAWYAERHRMSYVDTSAALTRWKKTDELAFPNEVSSVPLQQALRHLQAAFAAFFDKRARYPRSKSRKKSRACAEYTRSGVRSIVAAGLAVSACGAGVRPQRESSRTGRPATKQETHGATRGAPRH